MGRPNQPRDRRGRWTTTGAGRNLSSQREMMRKNSEGEAHIVYGYLRDHDTRYGKAGSPYYIGIGDKESRAYGRHRTGAHGVPVPKDLKQIRQFGVAKNRKEAEQLEKKLISHFGRIPIKGEKGEGRSGRRQLLNKSSGGGHGNMGNKHTEAALRKMSESKKGQQAWNKGRAWNEKERAKLSEAHKGKPGHASTPEINAKISQANKGRSNAKMAQTKLRASAALAGVPYEQWKNLTAKDRHTALRSKQGAAEWVKEKNTGALRQRTISNQATGRETGWARKNGIPETAIPAYQSMSKIQRNTMRKWMKRNPGKNAFDYMRTRGLA